MNTSVQFFPDPAALSSAAAQFVAASAAAAVREKGWWSLVLSGGTTPKLLYEYFAKPGFVETIPWDKTHLFWGDERWVPPEHEASNFRMAHEAFIAKLSMPDLNIHRMHGEEASGELAAARYEEELRQFFQTRYPGQGMTFPGFDLVLLGLGADGHTASLFPGDSAAIETKHWVVPVHAPQGCYPEARITLTLPVINNARTVLFLVAGAGKAGVLHDILENRTDSEKKYPAARVSGRENVVWFIDEGTVGKGKREV